MWVPGTIPPGLTERAIEAAWPGTHTITSAASAPLPPGALTEGGALRLARPEILPLSVSHDPDAPRPALAGAAAGLGDGEHAIVQVLARPVTGARLRPLAAPPAPSAPGSPPGCRSGCWTWPAPAATPAAAPAAPRPARILSWPPRSAPLPRSWPARNGKP